MKSIRIAALGAALVCLAGGAQAFTHHPSTAKERAQTKALNEQQLQLAQNQNADLTGSANASANTPAAGASASTEAEATTAPAADDQAKASDQQATTGNQKPGSDAAMVKPKGSGPTSGR